MTSGAAAKKPKGPNRSGDGATSSGASEEAHEATPWWRRWWALLTAGVVTLGSLASAISAITGLLWPEPDVLDKAEITSIETVEAVPLSEYERSTATPKRSGFLITNGSPLILLAAYAAHAPKTVPLTSSTPTPTPAPSPVPTPEPTISPTPPPSTWRAPLTRRFNRDVIEEVQEIGPQYEMPKPAKKATWASLRGLYKDDLERKNEAVAPEVAARRLVGIFGKTRMQQTERGKLDPLGVVVTANLRLDGFRDERLDVSWRITGRAKGRAPYSRWFKEVLAAHITPSRYSDGGAVEFWVPMPKRPGKYVVQVTIRHGHAPLFAKQSESFG